MALYDYKCLTCETEYEVTHSIKDDPYTEHECPKCSTVEPCKRLIGNNGGFKLKGSGWYKDGYENQYHKTLDLL